MKAAGYLVVFAGVIGILMSSQKYNWDSNRGIYFTWEFQPFGVAISMLIIGVGIYLSIKKWS
jgi:hypothetical protein